MQDHDLPLEEAVTVPPTPTGDLAAAVTVLPGLSPPHFRHPFPQIPGYEILCELGRGGMGVVYQARELKLQRLVAIKLQLSGSHASPEEMARFRKEAEAIALLQHPNVVQVFHVGEYEGKPFVVLEYVEGGSLASELKGKPWSARLAATMVLQLAQAVQVVHEKGIVHRDLKPANVLLTVDGEPKITDFGLAKLLQGGSGMTATGAVLGTPNYMAPEQAEGKSQRITAATDIYALGAILYELLACRPPFVGETPLDVIVQVVSEDPPKLSSIRTKLPSDLATICHKCLEKDPQKRYSSAAALAADLNHFLQDRPITARPVGGGERAWRWARRNPMVAGLTTAVLLCLTVGTIVATLFAVDARSKERTAVYEKFRADRETREAQEAQQRADELAAKARSERNEARRLLGMLAVSEGFREADDNNLFKALLWFAEPFVRDAENKEAEAAARFRITAYRRYVPAPTLTHLLPHHRDAHHVAFSPDGESVVTASEDGTARVWAVTTGQERIPALVHESRVTQAVFSPDSVLIATSSWDQTARVWYAATGKPRTPPLVHHDSVERVVFSPDGRWVATASRDKTARIWDTATGQPRTPPLSHRGFVHSVDFSSDGQWLVTACNDGTVHIWNVATGRARFPAMSHRSMVWQAVCSPDGLSVASISRDETVRVWDMSTGQLRFPPLEHRGTVWAVAFSPDGRWLATGSADMTARVWDATTGLPRTPPLRHLAFSPDGRWLATASADKTARVWDAATGQPLSPPLTHLGKVWNVAFSPDGRWLGTASSAQAVRLWNLAGNQPVDTPLLHPPRERAMALSPDGHWVVTAENRTVRLRDAHSGELRGSPIVQQSPITQVALSADGCWLATTGIDMTVRVWEMATGRPRSAPLRHSKRVGYITFSSDGQWLATACDDGKGRVWNAATGQLRIPPLSHSRAIPQIVFSHDGRWVATASWDQTVQVWDAQTGQPIFPALRHEENVELVAFSPDGRWLATADASKTARVWEVATGQARTPPLPHLERLTALTFSPDGRCLVTAGGKQVQVWDAATGQPLTPVLAHPSDVHRAEFTADGQALRTVCMGIPPDPYSPRPNRANLGRPQTVRFLWDMTVPDRPSVDYLHLCQLLAGHHIDATGGLVPLSAQQLQDFWMDLITKYPEDFRVTPAMVRQWRQEQLAACLKGGNLPGAFLHRDWLFREAIREQPQGSK